MPLQHMAADESKTQAKATCVNRNELKLTQAVFLDLVIFRILWIWIYYSISEGRDLGHRVSKCVLAPLCPVYPEMGQEMEQWCPV